ncbi:hypothetical protein JL720_3095 [Aureococcus anophagefferens]|nr:hypothetical protein JL720_3095 [Aureococcus anophagefferens]
MDDDLTSLERCASYDDDATYTRGSCASCDHAACFLYCTGYCDSMCGGACGGNVSSGAMCALDTLNNLESVCEDGGFCDATSSAATPTTASVAASSCTGCDSHALCSRASPATRARSACTSWTSTSSRARKAMILISDMNATCAAYACKNRRRRRGVRAPRPSAASEVTELPGGARHASKRRRSAAKNPR